MDSRTLSARSPLTSRDRRWTRKLAISPGRLLAVRVSLINKLDGITGCECQPLHTIDKILPRYYCYAHLWLCVPIAIRHIDCGLPFTSLQKISVSRFSNSTLHVFVLSSAIISAEDVFYGDTQRDRPKSPFGFIDRIVWRHVD